MFKGEERIIQNVRIYFKSTESNNSFTRTKCTDYWSIIELFDDDHQVFQLIISVKVKKNVRGLGRI